MSTRASAKPLVKATSNLDKLKKRTKPQTLQPSSYAPIYIDATPRPKPGHILHETYYESGSTEWGYYSKKEEPISDKTPTPPESPKPDINMAGQQNNPPDLFHTRIEDLPRTIPTSRQSAVLSPEIDTFTVKGNHLQMVKNLRFDRRNKRDPHEHVDKYEMICNLFNYGENQSNNVKMKLFPMSLTGEAHKWLKGLAPNSLTTWGAVREALIERFFPAIRERELRLVIHSFRQDEDESSVETWLRMKDLLWECPGHGVSDTEIVGIFMDGMNRENFEKMVMTCGGSITYKTSSELWNMFEDMAKAQVTRSPSRDRRSRKVVARVDEGETSEVVAEIRKLSNRMDEKFSMVENNFRGLERYVKIMAGGCIHCGGPHHADECRHQGNSSNSSNFYSNNRGGNFQNRWQKQDNHGTPQQKQPPSPPKKDDNGGEGSPLMAMMAKFLDKQEKREEAQKKRNVSTENYSKLLNDKIEGLHVKIDVEQFDEEFDEEVEMESPPVVTTSVPKATPIKEPEVKPYKPKIPFPQRLRKEKIQEQYNKFFDMIKSVTINVPLVDLISGMPNYAKFIKELVTDKKKLDEAKATFLNEECSAVIKNKLPPKLSDPGSFLIACSFGRKLTCKALADLGASINLMPYSVFTKLSLRQLRPTKMSICLADHSFQYPLGVAENLQVQVGQFVFLVDFVILEMEEDTKVPLILGRPFLYTADAIIRVKDKEISLGVGEDRIVFKIEKALKHSYSSDDTCFRIDVIDDVVELEKLELVGVDGEESDERMASIG
uniref:uncharacterized protein LOC122601380 n=1 Tax=Erigeron canadensis TaxID=72917 RepID=UPI001CB8F4AC|nr:uncharacterized protein LOC122601380 [Erigeron canadensis]